MLLLQVKSVSGWLVSDWQLTYGVGWESILRGARTAYEYFETPEVLRDGETIEVRNAEELAAIPEGGTLTVRGKSTIYHAPLMLTLYNQSQSAELMLPIDDGEFAQADYEAFNRSTCQFMDSLELAMHLN